MQPELQDRVVECHPELAFARLAGSPLARSKHTADGVAERVTLLEAALAGARRPGPVRPGRRRWPGRRVARGPTTWPTPSPSLSSPGPSPTAGSSASATAPWTPGACGWRSSPDRRRGKGDKIRWAGTRRPDATTHGARRHLLVDGDVQLVHARGQPYRGRQRIGGGRAHLRAGPRPLRVPPRRGPALPPATGRGARSASTTRIWIEDPDFDLDWHLREISLPAGKGDLTGLCELAAKLVAIPLDRTRPLWELWVIEGLDDGQVGLLTKVHHAAIDGASGEELMVAILDLEPDPDPRPEPEVPWEPDRVPSDTELVGYATWSLAQQPLRAARAARRTLAVALKVREQNRQPAHHPAAVAVQRTDDVVERTVDGRAQLRGVVAVADHRQGGQERVRVHRERRRVDDVRRRAAPLPGRPRRAPGRPARGHGARLGPLRGPEGHARQPGVDDADLAGHRPRRSRRAPAA